jgi:Ca-activated chloride channel family protein
LHLLKKLIMKYLLLPVLLVAIAFMAFVQPGKHTVTGIVTDGTGHTLTGVTVAVKGTSYAVATDSKGTFSIIVHDELTVLVFTYIGFDQQEVVVGKRTALKVVLQQQLQQLNEVVVVGYGKQQKMNMTGSVAMVTPTTLSGRMAGVYVRGRSGQPLQGLSGQLDKKYTRTNDEEFNTESYDQLTENPFLKATDNPLSTFSIDVDAASYSNIRRYISGGNLPPAGSVRIEEMINYFTYQYPQPTGEHPFSVNTELTTCPWNPQHQLALIGLQGKKVPYEQLPATNLVFLIDVSGSMMSENKLPLVKSSLQLLTDQLRPQDKVAIVVYAGNAGLVLPATSGEEKMKIKSAINALEAGGSTAGGAGIQLAYKVAKENFVKEGNNRVILCTDGDFNVGASSDASMVSLIEKERESGVFLTVLGYGMGNYKDSKMQQLADKGNGNHAYIDGISEAKKVLINEFGGTLFTIAKDVKLQVEFNPAKVQGYRLIGYENRILAKEDFNNDKKDAGDMGSGHTVTALYEIIPAGIYAAELDSVDKLRYQKVKATEAKTAFAGELLNIKLRYKQPDGEKSRLLEKPVKDEPVAFWKTSENLRFASAVASFGMQLLNSKYKGISSYKEILSIAEKAQGTDKEHYRAEFLQMVREAGRLDNRVTENRVIDGRMTDDRRNGR